MFNSIIKIELLKDGRSTWFPTLIIFYDAILAFITVLLMYFGGESYQEGYYYNTSPYLHQFLIISSIQLASVLIIVPVAVSIVSNSDRDRFLPEQFALIPGALPRYISAKIAASMLVSGVVFLSALPITFVSCIYSDVGWLKLIRLTAIVLLLSFWSTSITVFFYTIWHRGGAAVAAILFQLLFILVSLGLVILIGRYYTVSAEAETAPVLISNLCLLLLLMNPLSSYMGYYGNLTGNIGWISRLCGQVGINSSGTIFTLLFYKGAAIMLALSGLAFFAIAMWASGRTQRIR